MTIGSITVDLLARTGSFETDMNRAAKTAEKRAKEIDAAVTRAGVAVGAALGVISVASVALVSRTVETIASFKDMSDKIGDTAEQIATLQTAFALSGTSADTFTAASIKLTASLAKTDDESKAVGTALKDIGLEFESFKRLSPVQQMDAVAKALDTFADGAGKTAIAVALFGKSGAELLPFLHDLAEGGERQIKLTGDQIAAADEYTKATARLRSEFDAFIQQQTAGLIPALTQVQELMSDLAKNQATVETVTDVLGGAIKGVTVVFQTLAVVASDVGFVFLGVGREIAAITAQLDALVRMDFSGFTAISAAVKEDGKRARAELDAFQARVMGVGEKLAETKGGMGGVLDFAGSIAGLKPPLIVTPPPSKTGGGAKKDNSAAQEAKAQLALDLEDIKKGTSALTGAFDNREKILSAQRSASLISEADYYEEKRKLQVEGDQAEMDGLQRQLDRLREEQQQLTGKDAIDNQRKIADAVAALNKARADSAANLKVLDIQAADSVTKIANAFNDARDAAQSFLDVSNRARALEVAGMGQGTKARDLNSAISQIEQTYEQKRQDLERDNRNGKFAGRKDDYDRELALINEFQKKSIDSYKDYYEQIELRQKSFALGASEAARNYFDESQNAFKQTEEAVTRAFGGMEDALVDFVKTGKLDFKSLVDSILSDVARIVIKQQITGPLAGLLSDALKGSGGAGAVSGDADYLKLIGLSGSSGLGITGGSGGGLLGQVGTWLGGIFGGKFAEGGSPPMGKVSLVGEKGPELFVPNTAGKIIPNHALGGAGGRAAPISVVIQNTIGDVASMAQVMQAQQGTERRIAAEIAKSRTRGGILA